MWKDLRVKEDHISQHEAKAIEAKLADKYAEGIYNDIKTEIEGIKYEEGVSTQGIYGSLRINSLRSIQTHLQQ